MRIQDRVRRIGRRLKHGTSLDKLIPPEIRNDGFYAAIVRVAATPSVRHMLEIGASGGDGSTEAFIEGAMKNPSRPTLHSIEISDVRFQAFTRRHASRSFVRGYHASAVPLANVASVEEVTAFYHSVKSPLNDYPLTTVLGWREQDVRYIREHGLDTNGIKQVKQINGLSVFDAVLIDGSEFTGSAELDEVYGASYILLDDIRSFKNNANFARLTADPAYVLVEASEHVRNGYAVFRLAAIDRAPISPLAS